MNDLWKTKIGRRTITIVRLKREDSDGSWFAARSYGVSLGYSPYSVQYAGDKQLTLDIYSAIAKWASKNDITTVGGPILSGAVLAEGIAARSKRLLAFYIAKRKGYYRPYKHPVEKVKGIFRGKYIIVDDAICSGNSMEIALANVKSENCGSLEGLEAVLSLGGGVNVHAKSHPLLAQLINEGKVFGLYCLERRKS
jgi:orotate phosphoribosyltransferase